MIRISVPVGVEFPLFTARFMLGWRWFVFTICSCCVGKTVKWFTVKVIPILEIIISTLNKFLSLHGSTIWYISFHFKFHIWTKTTHFYPIWAPRKGLVSSERGARVGRKQNCGKKPNMQLCLGWSEVGRVWVVPPNFSLEQCKILYKTLECCSFVLSRMLIECQSSTFNHCPQHFETNCW